MKNLHRLIIATTLLLSIQGIAYAQQQDKEMDAAIKQYLKVAPADLLLDNAMAEFVKAVPEDSRATIEETFRTINRERITRAMVDSLKKHFTVAEVKAIAKFYGSAEGKSVMKKLGIVQAELLPVIQTELATALQKTYDKQQKASGNKE